MFKNKITLTKEDQLFIRLFQAELMASLQEAQKQLSEEELAYCLKRALKPECLKLVIHHL